MGTFGTPSSYNNTGALGSATNPTTAQGLSRDRENQKAILELPGTQAWVEKTITDGVIIPTSAEIIVLPEGGASTDSLTTIALTSDGTTTLHEGMLIRLKAANSDAITVVHGIGTNNISTIDGNDVVLDTTWYLELKLINGLWVQQETNAYRIANTAKIMADAASAPATTTARGIGRVATAADVAVGSTITNGPAFLDAATWKVSATPAAGVIPIAGSDGHLPQGWLGTMLCNKRLVVTTSGNFVAPKAGWYRVKCIGAGGAGGGYSNTAGGLQGGTTSFGALLSAVGGSGGGGGAGGGGGGGAGKVTDIFVYLTEGQSIACTIGAGGLIGTGAPTGPEAGINGIDGLSAGTGAAGASTGSGISSSSNNAPVGGAGGINGTGYGGGGGGAGGNYPSVIRPGAPGGDGGKYGLNTDTGAGGPGAIIIEYFDPSVTS